MTAAIHSMLAVPLLTVMAFSQIMDASSASSPSASSGNLDGTQACDSVPSVELTPAPALPPLTGRDRWRIYAKDTFASPVIVVRTGFPALFSHLDNDPAQWGQGAAAYSHRLADRYGRFLIRQSIESAGAAALRHEVRYLPSGRSSFGGRVGHAFLSTVVTTDSRGHRVPHLARGGGILAAEFLGNAWMPPGYRTSAQAWRNVGIRLSFTAAFNLLREFQPEIRRLTSRH
ncbi:MAG: hypothetical protein ACUVXB_09770 [Bryobacteraceae bacterium]